MKKSCSNPFKVIVGGKAELEHKKRLFFNQPWLFTFDEFDQLCEQFEVPRAEAFDLCLMCIRHKAKTNYEAAAVLAIFEGGTPPSDILASGRRKDFKLETSSPQAVPQSSAPNGEALA